jgi:hypothetical protein
MSMLIVHHEKKGAEEDFAEAVSGSFGLTGAADSTISLKRARGKDHGELRTTGRDASELEWSVRFLDGRWEFISEIVEDTDERDALDEAMGFLNQELVGTEVEAAVVKKHASELGITGSTLKRAKKKAGVRSLRRDEKWFWSRGEQ